MRDHKYLDDVVQNSVRSMLGVPEKRETTTCTILDTADDHIFIWNNREQAVLVVSMSVRDGDRIQTLNLMDSILHDVAGLCVTGRGKWIAVYGDDGITAIEVPRRGGNNGRIGGGESQLICRTVPIYRDRSVGNVEKVAWHPGYGGDNHLLVLTTDGSLSLYQVNEDSARPVRHVSLGGSRVATALGETAVDFCFGSSVECHSEDLVSWPVFVLWADGDVFYVNTSAEEWEVEGPLDAQPEAEDYSTEACSLILVDGKSGPAVLAVARTNGIVLHHVMLGDNATGRPSLHLYQKVELDIGPLNSTSSSSASSTFSCPLRLVADSSNRSRYLVLHNAGLHQVEIPLTHQDEDVADTDLQCTVEHILCTLPTSNSPPAPLLGAAVAYPPATILCLTADHQLQSIKCKPSVGIHMPGRLGTDSFTTQSQNSQSKENIEDRIRQIFAREVSLPLIMSGAGTNLSKNDTFDLLLRATETLDKEYMVRAQEARKELAAATLLLKGKKASQEVLLNKLQSARGDLRLKAETISERYEDIKDRSAALSDRVEAVLAKAQTQLPAASDAELKMARDLKALNQKMEQVRAATELIKEKEKYQRYQMQAAAGAGYVSNSRLLSQDQVENAKEVLQGDSATITDLVKSVATVKKDLAVS
eukprot:TRINITY_DN20958_c0_g1_i1.p1 TRINITY_DN20958_c0_g1~~TRINITY_DN20958_c0_g1_i1.p1  ORF type:complete len:659 (-),score=88.39 TRINITY_DN20958_c0_g1_i1:79-2019(-)